MHRQLHRMVLFAMFTFVAAKYEIQLLGFEIFSDLTDTSIIDPGTLRLKQEQRNTFVFTGTMIAKRNFGNRDTVKVEYFQKLMTGNFMMLYTITMTMCDATKSSYYPTFRESSNFPPPGTCPLLEGNYTIYSLVIDESFFPKMLPRGENYVLTTIYVNGEPAYGAKMSTNIKYLHY